MIELHPQLGGDPPTSWVRRCPVDACETDGNGTQKSILEGGEWMDVDRR